ncbi:glycosyl hydrolase [Paenibacillus agricola]|uniref:Alpha-L-rhamnosidase-like protein n=1 Tax=Paenibacillus agricola TaxID=2716264 RepID=A0ABX0JIL4_9BACL|nr:glycosyl hydrolase [Paenibacillus agricola]NHN33630.1 hypothetical protein [Paenibacillus agricola]
MLNEKWFRNPPVEFRVLPFWFWNGDLQEAEIVRQIDEMADKGLGGFFICARQGITVPYLSQQWFDRVRTAIGAAERRGLQVWLYDEYPYPSGIAGGEVTLEHPEAKQRTLTRHVATVQNGEEAEMDLPWGRVLSAKAVPLHATNGTKQWEHAIDVSKHIGNFQDEPIFQQNGSTVYNPTRYFTYNTIKKLIWPGISTGKSNGNGQQWQITVIVEQEAKDFKYFGTFVDPLHAGAMETFVRLTHERYAEEIGEHFGTTVKGMFTDEIGLRIGKIPWSPALPAFFEDRCGYSLLDHLHHLFEDTGEAAAKVRYDFMQCVHLLMRSNYHHRVYEWCDRNQLEYIAEVPGVRMTTQLYSHIPGGDTAHEKLGRPLAWIMKKYGHSLRANPKMGSSLARQLGRNRALIECFHSVGWSMTLQDARWMIDWMAALGTNMFNFHAFFYSIDGMRKHDAPPSQFYQNPYWKHFSHLADYVGRISSVMTQGTAQIDIAIMDPSTSLWTHLATPFHQFQYWGSNDVERQRLDQMKVDWVQIQTALLTAQRDFDTIDPEIIMQADIGNGLMNVGKASYKVLIIPPITNMEAAAWSKIKSFIEAGGSVISIGMLPYEEIEAGSGTVAEISAWFRHETAETSEAGTAVAFAFPPNTSGEGAFNGTREGNREGAYFLPLDPDQPSESYAAVHLNELLALLERICPRRVELHAEDGDTQCLLLQHRNMGDQADVLFISNREGAQKQVTVHLSELDFGFMDSAWYRDLENGETRGLKADRTESGWAISLKFAPYQSHLIELRGGQQKNSKELVGNPVMNNAHALLPATPIQVVIDSQWSVETTAPNMLRIGSFRMAIDPDQVGVEQKWYLGKGDAAAWFDVDTKTWINQCADLADELKLSLDYKKYGFGTPLRTTISYPITVWYTSAFVVNVLPVSCELLMDQEAILGEYIIYVNGQVWNKGSLPLVVGDNSIAIRLVVGHDHDGIVDPLYVSGAFGVGWTDSGKPVITEIPTAANPNAEVIAGFPYYSGTFVFRRSCEIPSIPEKGSFELSLAGLSPNFHDCAELSLNGASLGVRAWTPYCWQGSTELIRLGTNDVELRIENTLSHRLDGTYFDYKEHRLRDVSKYIAESEGRSAQ